MPRLPVIELETPGEAAGVRLIAEADAFRDAGSFNAAKPLYRQAVEDRIAAFGEKHEAVAVAINRLANIHYQLKQDRDAAEWFERALTIREAVLPPEAPDLRLSVNNLANCYRNLGRYAEAEILYRRSLAMLKRLTGTDQHPPLWNNLARCLEGQGCRDEAETFRARSRDASCSPP